MIRNFISIVLLLLFASNLIAQQKEYGNHFGKEFMFNVSGTYIYNTFPEWEGHNFHEITMSAQAGVSIFKSLMLGFQVMTIYTDGTYSEPNIYFIKGAFLHYDIFPKQRHSLLIQTSFSNGDYCTCGDFDSYRKANLNYLGTGIGFDSPIKKSQFYFTVSFNAHWILNEIEEDTNFNIYKIGVTYKFGKGIN